MTANGGRLPGRWLPDGRPARLARSRATGAALGMALVLGVGVLSGCADDDSPGRPPPLSDDSARPGSANPKATPQPSATLTDEQQVVAQYRRFWLEVLPKAFAAPESQRRAILTPVVIDPELDLILNNVGATDDNGEVGYGVDVPLRQTVTIKGDLALVRGCLDSSRAGIADRKSGRRKIKGVPQNPVLVNLRRGGDRAWRVSAIRYPGGRHC